MNNNDIITVFVTVHTPLSREVFWHENAKIPRHTAQNLYNQHKLSLRGKWYSLSFVHVGSYFHIEIYVVENGKNSNQLVGTLVQRILSNCYIDLSDFSSAALSSIAVATATPHSSALQLKKSSCVNIAET